MESRIVRREPQSGAHHAGGFLGEAGAKQQVRQTQGCRGVRGIGSQRLAVAGFGVRGPPEHLQHQGAVGQRSRARRTRGAFEHLVEER